MRGVKRLPYASAGQQCSVRVDAFVNENRRYRRPLPVNGLLCQKAGAKPLETITGLDKTGIGIRPAGFLKRLGQDNLGM